MLRSIVFGSNIGAVAGIAAFCNGAQWWQAIAAVYLTLAIVVCVHHAIRQ